MSQRGTENAAATSAAHERPAPFDLPAGLEAVKRAPGRPRKESRDAAVFLARVYRIQAEGGKEVRGATARADEWIVQEWKHHGITRTEHVRGAIDRAEARGLSASLISRQVVGAFELWTAVECKDGVLKNGVRAWCWWPGLLAAEETRVKNFRQWVAQPPQLTPIASLLRSLGSGS